LVELKKKIVGIIGGAGVAATNKLNCLIEDYFTRNGAFRDSHHPEIIIYQGVNVPSRSMFLEGKGESFIPGYTQIGNELKSIGANILCMSCNTAHYAIDDLQRNIGIPFINMVEMVVKQVADNTNHGRVGLIASDGCLLGKVYERYFLKYLPGIKIIYPDKLMQKEVTRGICNIKNSNRFLGDDHPDRPKKIFKNVCNHLVESNAEIIVSGCTDITVDFMPEDFNRVKIIDSLIVLSQGIIREYIE
jgi:aspartate racemase